MNPNHSETSDASPPKKRKGSKKDKDDEHNTKKRSRKSKSSTTTDDESIIDITESINSAQSSMFTELSPPASDENSSDFEDLLGSEFLNPNTQYAAGSDPLNLAVQGIKIEAPDWWSDSLTGQDISRILEASNGGPLHMNNQINLPNSHPWSVNKSDIEEAIAALEDVDDLLYNDGLAGPALNPHTY